MPSLWEVRLGRLSVCCLPFVPLRRHHASIFTWCDKLRQHCSCSSKLAITIWLTTENISRQKKESFFWRVQRYLGVEVEIFKVIKWGWEVDSKSTREKLDIKRKMKRVCITPLRLCNRLGGWIRAKYAQLMAPNVPVKGVLFYKGLILLLQISWVSTGGTEIELRKMSSPICFPDANSCGFHNALRFPWRFVR